MRAALGSGGDVGADKGKPTGGGGVGGVATGSCTLGSMGLTSCPPRGATKAITATVAPTRPPTASAAPWLRRAFGSTVGAPNEPFVCATGEDPSASVGAIGGGPASGAPTRSPVRSKRSMRSAEIRSSGAPKAALLEVQSDEYGGGRPERMHSALFERTMAGLDLDPSYGAYLGLLPGITLATLVMLFGFYALLDGSFSLITAIGGRRRRDDRWLLILEGVVGIWAGVVTLRAPAVTAVVLVFFMSIWAMSTGFLRIVGAIRLRKEISGEVWLVLSGLASVLFAFMLMLRPGVGALALVWIIAGYALVMGVFLVMLGIELSHPHAEA